MKNLLSTKKITEALRILILAIVLGFSTHLIFAQEENIFSSPPSSFPVGQPAALLNAGSVDQDKLGGLSLGGPFFASMNSAFGGSLTIDGSLTVRGGSPAPGATLVSNGFNGAAIWAEQGGFASYTAGGEVQMTPESTVYLSTHGVEHAENFGIVMPKPGFITSISGSSQVSGYDNRGPSVTLTYTAGINTLGQVGSENTVSASTDITADGLVSAYENINPAEATFNEGDIIFLRQFSNNQTYTTKSIVNVKVRFFDTVSGGQVYAWYPIPLGDNGDSNGNSNGNGGGTAP